MSKLSSHHHNHNRNNNNSLSAAKSSVAIAAAAAFLLVLVYIHSLHVIPLSGEADRRGSPEHDVLAERLRRSVTFLPLKDLRYSRATLEGHTWFMSSLHDHRDSDGDAQHLRFSSPESDGRVLCLSGRDSHDGAWNSYALAWPETLPRNATLTKGLTFVSYNHYDYENIWHGLSAVVPLVAWHQGRGCGAAAAPDRWVLYHWGELRLRMGPWLAELMEAAFGGGAPAVEGFSGSAGPVCFEEAVVARHNEGGMSRERRVAVYDFLRCKARVYCNVSRAEGEGNITAAGIGMTVLMRTGPRSFRDGPAVVGIFRRECARVEGCRFRVAYSANLTFCEQVKLMSSTDVLISPHGAQLTNMFLMDRNSSVMEFFPKGWLELAGVGQYVFRWIASWSGMHHQGAWRDPHPDQPCPHPDNDPRCMRIYKNNMIGHNQTYFSEWTRRVLKEAKEVSKGRSFAVSSPTTSSSVCPC